MNPFNSSFLLNETDSLAGLLLRSICESSNVFGSDDSLNVSLINLKMQLFSDTNPRRYQILLEKKYDEMLVYTMDKSFKTRNFKLLHSVLSVLVTISNNSEEFIDALMNTKFSDLMIDEMLVFFGLRISLMSLDLINLYIIIIFNITRHYKFRQYFLENVKIANFKTGLVKLLSVDHDNMKVTSFLILAFLTESDNADIKLLLKYSNIINDINEWLCNAVESDDKTYRSFDVWELLVGLEALSSIDPIKAKMISIDGLDKTINKIASSKTFKTKEVSVALAIKKNLGINVNSRQSNSTNLFPFQSESTVPTIITQLIAIQLDSSRSDEAKHRPPPQPPSPDRVLNRIGSNEAKHRPAPQPTSLDRVLNKSGSDDYKYRQLSEAMPLDKPESSNANFSQWNKARVSQWLNENKLTDIHNKFNEFDGEMLASIKEMKDKSADRYFKHLDESMGLSFTEILRFDCALGKL